MKIAFFCNEYPPKAQGGIGTFVHVMARGLVSAGHEVSVVGFGRTGRVTYDEGVKLTLIKSATEGNSWRDRFALRKWLHDQVKAHQTDVFEIPEYGGVLPFRVLGVRVVVRHHQSSTAIALVQRRIPSPWHMLWERATLATHGDWIGVSKFILKYNERLFRVRPRRATTIYSPLPQVDREHLDWGEARRREVGRYAVYVGKLTRSKGAFSLARAATMFLRHRRDLRLVFVGPDVSSWGRLGSERIRAIVGRELAARVLLAGPVPHNEALGWIAGAELLVLPSFLEALGMSALEAVACGVPVVMSRGGPGSELIEDEESGLLIDPSDPERIAACVERVVDDRKFARALTARAEAQARQRHSLERCIHETLEFYQEAGTAGSWD